MTIQPSGTHYATGETCEWMTDYSATHGFALHVVEHDEYAQLELITRDSDDGGIIDMGCRRTGCARARSSGYRGTVAGACVMMSNGTLDWQEVSVNECIHKERFER